MQQLPASNPLALAAGRKPPIDKTSPSPFGPPLHDLVNHAVGLDRGWSQDAPLRALRGNPNFPAGWFTPMYRNT